MPMLYPKSIRKFRGVDIKKVPINDVGVILEVKGLTYCLATVSGEFRSVQVGEIVVLNKFDISRSQSNLLLTVYRNYYGQEAMKRDIAYVSREYDYPEQIERLTKRLKEYTTNMNNAMTGLKKLASGVSNNTSYSPVNDFDDDDFVNNLFKIIGKNTEGVPIDIICGVYNTAKVYDNLILDVLTISGVFMSINLMDIQEILEIDDTSVGILRLLFRATNCACDCVKLYDKQPKKNTTMTAERIAYKTQKKESEMLELIAKLKNYNRG